jgi:prepilin signal peptidase PulO-like enzyme (type II secretory pathway)
MALSVFTVVFSGILGACLGSFANVLAVRWHEMGAPVGRSRCPLCRKTIRPKHLVPIFSYLILRGRCADCKAKIHIQYPLVELAVAILSVVAALRHNPLGSDFPAFAVELALVTLLAAIVVMDLRWKELPVEIMALIGFSALIVHVFAGSSFDIRHSIFELRNLVLAVALPLVFFGAQWLLSRGKWLGGGDVWFGVMMGLVLGNWQMTALAIYISYLAGGCAAAILLMTKILKRGANLPFAPFLALGLMLTVWFGISIQAWIAKFIF